MPQTDSMNLQACCLIYKAHAESHKEQPDLKRMGGIIYETLHASGFHPDAWFAAFLCYRRVGNRKLANRYFREACTRGDQQKYTALAQRFY